MNVLFEIYGSSYRISGAGRGRSSGEPNREVRKVTVVMTVLCLAGIAFNIRFLVALCNEQSGNANNQLFERHEHGVEVSRSPRKLDNTDRSEKGYF